MIILPIEIRCSTCGAQPGVPCTRPDVITFSCSYSFHVARIAEARRLMEKGT
jgi:hypothetical protein